MVERIKNKLYSLSFKDENGQEEDQFVSATQERDIYYYIEDRQRNGYTITEICEMYAHRTVRIISIGNENELYNEVKEELKYKEEFKDKIVNFFNLIEDRCYAENNLTRKVCNEANIKKGKYNYTLRWRCRPEITEKSKMVFSKEDAKENTFTLKECRIPDYRTINEFIKTEKIDNDIFKDSYYYEKLYKDFMLNLLELGIESEEVRKGDIYHPFTSNNISIPLEKADNTEFINKFVDVVKDYDCKLERECNYIEESSIPF